MFSILRVNLWRAGEWRAGSGLTATVAGIPLQGRVDRLDEGPDGLRVIDYKSRWRLGDLRKRIKHSLTMLQLSHGPPLVGVIFF